MVRAVGHLKRDSARLFVALMLIAFASSGCASYGLNYLHPDRPRCAGIFRAESPEVTSEELKIVSFNIKFSKEPEKALRTLTRAGLDDADVLLLQEMDLPGTITIARGLHYDYVYYPAGIHPASGRQFGVAILSPWPIRNDRKILLPHLESSDDLRKIAAVATVWVQGIPIGVVNAHLQSGLSPQKLGDQLQVIINCIFTEVCLQAESPMLAGLPYYVIAGDFNTRGKPHLEVAQEVLSWSGFEQVPGIEKTHKYAPGSWGRLDHIFVSKNLEVEDSGVDSKWFGTGSDHRPLWAVLRLSGPGRKAWDGFDASAPWDASTDSNAKQCKGNP